jgi:hypothetical protein
MENKDMKGKKDGTVSNEKDYTKLTAKIESNQTFFKKLAEHTEKTSKSNREHIQRMEEKLSSSPK